jgi:S1-C subfamily serine protease
LRGGRAGLVALLGISSAGCTAAPPLAAPATSAPATTTTAAALPTTTDPPDIDSTLLASGRNWAFRVRTVSCLGTGSSFEVAGGIVTNRHVASGSSTLELATWDGTDFNANVSGISIDGPDLALLRASEAPVGSVPAPLASSDPPSGIAVYAVGYPEGNQLTVTPGHVIDYIDGSSVGVTGQVMEITNTIQPGNSGSALLNGQGQVVGVVFALRISNGLGLAIPISELDAFLASPGTQLAPQCAE